MSKNKFQIKNLKGFTLIEILLAVAIIGIFSTTTYVVFTRFNRQQNITIAERNIINDLAEAKAYALSHVVFRCKAGDIPGVLVGYQLTFNIPNTNEYSLQEVCRYSISGVTEDRPLDPVKTKKLPADISFIMGAGNTPAYIRFNTLSGGASFPNSIDNEVEIKIRSSNNTQEDSITVNSQGVIQ